MKNCELYKEKVSLLYSLNKCWIQNEPKETRIECESFVLSLATIRDNIVVGLNNGCIQGRIVFAMILTYISRDILNSQKVFKSRTLICFHLF